MKLRGGIGIISVAIGLAPLAATQVATVLPPPMMSGPAIHAGTTAPTGADQYSINWSGYAATPSKPVTDVVSTFVIPTVACLGDTPESAVWWVGMDGASDGTVEQDGVMAYCYGPGEVEYLGWWEMYPTNYVTYFSNETELAAGDTVTESVSYATNGKYTLKVSDVTKKLQATEMTACASNVTCNRSSAEWIGESPYFTPGGWSDLPQWKPAVNFYPDQMSVKSNHALSYLGGFVNEPFVMVGSAGVAACESVAAQCRAVPSTIGRRGRGFADQWESEAP